MKLIVRKKFENLIEREVGSDLVKLDFFPCLSPSDQNHPNLEVCGVHVFEGHVFIYVNEREVTK